MSDRVALSQIESLTIQDYINAFNILREQMTESDLRLLRAHYESPNYDITATQLANLTGYPNYETANLRYGLLAGKFLRFFLITLLRYVKINIFVQLEFREEEWHWILRPNVIYALRELRWFGETPGLNVLKEIELYKASYEYLPITTREFCDT